MSELPQKILDTLERDLGYKPIFDEPVGKLGLPKVMDAIFREPDPVKLNMVILHLLSAGDAEMAGKVGYMVATFYSKDIVDKLTTFTAKRIYYANLYNHTKSGNRTEDIPFSRGIVTASTPKLMSDIKSAMEEEDENAGDDSYGIVIHNFVCCVDEIDSKVKPSFCVLDEDENLVGYIALCCAANGSDPFGIERFGVSSYSAYNLEYYTMPNFRKKGYMKDALSAFLKAVANGGIQYLKNAVTDYQPVVENLRIKLVYALIGEDNVASQKTIESLGLFELLKESNGDVVYKDGGRIYTMRL